MYPLIPFCPGQHFGDPDLEHLDYNAVLNFKPTYKFGEVHSCNLREILWKGTLCGENSLKGQVVVG